MMEMVDLYNENRIPLGRTAERHAPKGPGSIAWWSMSAPSTAGGAC